MSRGGTPTDNPIIEALNGWMKEELYLDFDLAHSHDVPALLDAYVYFFNNHRPAAALGYKSPVQFKTERGFWQIFLFSVYFCLTSAASKMGAGLNLGIQGVRIIADRKNIELS